jgi:MFS family permease
LETEDRRPGNSIIRSITKPRESDAAVSHGKSSTLRRTLPFVTWEGVFAANFISLTGSPFLIGFALFLGANDFEIGLLAAIPFLTQIAQLLAAYNIDLTGKCKVITIKSLLLAREIWWLLLPLPFMHGEWRLKYMLLVFVLSSVGAAMGAVGWFAWVADLIPMRVRGRYFGFRSASLALATVVTFLFAGAALDYFEKIGRTEIGFALLIVVACASGLLAAFMMNKLPEKKSSPSSAGIDNGYFLEPLKSGEFRKLLIIFFVWNLGTGVAGAFFAAHMLTNLQMSFTQVSIYSAASLIAAILSNKPWGSLIDRYGSKPIIVACSLGLSIVPAIWLIPRPDYLWILGFETVYAGILWAGLNLAAFNLPLSLSPEKNRTIYLATFAVASGVGFFLASLAGGALAENWRWVRYSIGPQVIVNYHILFVISTIVRAIGALMTFRIKEPLSREMPGVSQLLSFRFGKRSKWLR